ncbi:MAG: DNA alkylation repair protein [Oscillospiraceae bacterium]|nr:DNA alkylation repair protein [Oscillospiraceae bacterium]
MTVEEIRAELFALADEAYRQFHARLIPNVDPDAIIGVRTPALRAFARQLHRFGGYGAFLEELPHFYYEENNLHAFLLERIKDFDDCVAALDQFLPYVDNWATCDMMRPPVLKKEPEKLMVKIRQWLTSESVYAVRYAIVCLMNYYLDENFRPEQLDLLCGIKSEEYYINMALAWYFATALSKQWDSVIGILESRRLPEWVHKKAIQKSLESRRITPEQKEYLRRLK